MWTLAGELVWDPLPRNPSELAYKLVEVLLGRRPGEGVPECRPAAR
jgi:hypothetical protein